MGKDWYNIYIHFTAININMTVIYVCIYVRIGKEMNIFYRILLEIETEIQLIENKMK